MSDAPTIYAFIDSQNLNRGIRAQGWALDFRRFREYLRREYGVSKAYLFIGMVAAEESLYTNLQSMDYIVIFKPTLENAEGEVKGNVDADLVLHAMIEYPNYDKAIIVSGDGDFHSLVKHLADQGKLEKLLVPNWRYSSLMKEFEPSIVRVDQLKRQLELRRRKKSTPKPEQTSSNPPATS